MTLKEPLAGPLDPGARALVERIIAARLPGVETGTLATARLGFRTSRQALAPQSPQVALKQDFPRQGACPPLRLYRGWGTEPDMPLPALLFFHSGGWVSGDLETHDIACRSIANAARCVVVAVDYALAPESPFPAAVEDSIAAYARVAEGDLPGIDPARIVVGGDSAGANIAAVLALVLRDAGESQPCGQILLYPATTFAEQTPSRMAFENGPTLNGPALRWFAAQYLPRPDDAQDWRASPLLAPSHAGLPPAFVTTCGHDPLRDEGLAYAERLRAAGVAVESRHFPGQIHGFLTMGGVMPETTILIGETAAFLVRATAGRR